MVAHVCDPSLGDGGRRMAVRVQPRQKSERPYLKNALKEQGLDTWLKS
jgi:hypothetical protein